MPAETIKQRELAGERQPARAVVLNDRTRAMASDTGAITILQRRPALFAGQGAPAEWSGVTIGPNEMWTLVRAVKRWHLYHTVQPVYDRGGSRVAFHVCQTCNVIIEEELL